MSLERPRSHGGTAPSSVLLLLLVITALIVATAALTMVLVAYGPGWSRSGMMYGNGMLRGAVPGAGAELQPGQPGFVPGTTTAPRTIRIWAGPGYAFSPSAITVARGETVTFVVTTMGPLVHEFMVGPAEAVAGDVQGTPEVSDIGMMQSASLTFTFDGTGPYAFACHAPGHFEAGMRGSIAVVG